MSQAWSFLATDVSDDGVAIVAEGVAGSVADVDGSIVGVAWGGGGTATLAKTSSEPKIICVKCKCN